MKSVSKITVKWFSKRFKVRIPLRAPEENKMIFICAPDGCNYLLVQRFKQRIKVRAVKVVCNRLI